MLQAVFALSSFGVLPMSMNPEFDDALLKGKAKRSDPYFIAHGSLDVLKDTNASDHLPTAAGEQGLFVLEADGYTYHRGSADETGHPVYIRLSGVRVRRLDAASYAVLWGFPYGAENDTHSPGGAKTCQSE